MLLIFSLAYRAGTHVGFGLRKALNDGLAEGRLAPLPAATDEEVTERIIALHTKRSTLPILAARVRKGWEPIRNAALVRDPADDEKGLDVAGLPGWGFIADVEYLLSGLQAP